MSAILRVSGSTDQEAIMTDAQVFQRHGRSMLAALLAPFALGPRRRTIPPRW